MDNYEINILRRGGNWRKVQADDLIMHNKNDDVTKHDKLKENDSNNNFNSHVEKINEIILKLEVLEDQKNVLKDELKKYEDVLLKKMKVVDDKINKFSQERKFIDKTLQVIKNLKSF